MRASALGFFVLGSAFGLIALFILAAGDSGYISLAQKTIPVCPEGPPKCDFANIQDAINAAGEGDTIQIAPGTYKESLVIRDKALVLRGAGPDQTILDGKGRWSDGITITGGARVTIDGLTVRDYDIHGLAVVDAAQVTLKDSTVEKNGTFADCAKADWICNGITVMKESQTTIINSIIRNNADWGVAAYLKKCGYRWDDFTGKVTFQDNTQVHGNGAGNVCLP